VQLEVKAAQANKVLQVIKPSPAYKDSREKMDSKVPLDIKERLENRVRPGIKVPKA